MFLRKCFLSIAFIFIFTFTSYAFGVSLGFSGGGGFPILRGNYAQELRDTMESVFDEPIELAGHVQLDLMVEILPFLALETGVGFSSSTILYIRDDFLVSGNLILNRFQAFVPIMLRLQYEYSFGVTYISTGVKLGFPMLDYLTSSVSAFDIPFLDAAIESEDLVLDVAFALGQEFRLGKANYIGVRLGYDLNVMYPHYENVSEADRTDLYHDNFTVSLTYRYAFN